MTTPDLQALIELSDDDLCDVIEMMDAMEVARIMRRLAAAPTLPGAGGGDARDAARYRWLRERMCVEDMPKDHPSWSTPSEHEPAKIDAAIDAALPPQQGG